MSLAFQSGFLTTGSPGKSGPFWQNSRREAALPWARLAQTYLDFRLPPQEGAGCVRLGDATGAFLASALPLPCLCTQVPSVLEEGSGAGGLHTTKGSRSESSVGGIERQQQGSFSGCLAAQTQRHTESTRFQGPLAGFCSPEHPEADSMGAQKVCGSRELSGFPFTGCQASSLGQLLMQLFLYAFHPRVTLARMHLRMLCVLCSLCLSVNLAERADEGPAVFLMGISVEFLSRIKILIFS